MAGSRLCMAVPKVRERHRLILGRPLNRGGCSILIAFSTDNGLGDVNNGRRARDKGRRRAKYGFA